MGRSNEGSAMQLQWGQQRRKLRYVSLRQKALKEDVVGMLIQGQGLN
jgi:hypothetical protein